MSALETDRELSLKIRRPAISEGDFDHEYGARQSFPEKERLNQLADHFSPIPLAEAWRYFDNPPEFISKDDEQQLRYLYLGFGHANNEQVYARPPLSNFDNSWMLFDTHFFLYFFADFQSPQKVSRYKLGKDPANSHPPVLAVCGFDLVRTESKEIFYHLRQYQASKWSSGEKIITPAEKELYQRDLPLRWALLGTHVTEQLAKMSSEQGAKVPGVFIDPASKYSNEKLGMDQTTTKGERVIRKRNYFPYVKHPRKELVVHWKPVGLIAPDVKFQNYLKATLDTLPPQSKSIELINKAQKLLSKFSR